MRKNGFTLIELIIAMGIGALIMTALYASMNMAQKSSASVGRKVVTQQDARSVLGIMAMEIRMASLNPSMSRTIWTTIPTASCTSMGSATPVKANKGIQVAQPDRILIAMDLNNPPDSAATSEIGDEENEYIEYQFNAYSKKITRNVSCSGDWVILGGDDLSTTVSNDSNTPLFQYFDRAGNATTSIPDIRRIRITIVADTKNTDSLTGKVKRMTYTTDVLV
ncbi:MAG: prepilin-type N-terminal cleavage/methylation domain-containing protein, partial [Smithella sp.]